MNRFLFICGMFVASFLLFPLPIGAYHILYYYNSGDDTEGGTLECVNVLQKAGHQVTVRDVRGDQRDPSGDNWGAPYDQVWDMRFVNQDKPHCGSGLPGAADYFDEHWRAKALSFLDRKGKLFLAGEHYQMADRNEGLYRFLKEAGAVKKGYDDCPPSSNGNNTTEEEVFYPVRNGLGPSSFFGAYVGGIPLRFLTGTSFVQTDKDWRGDQVLRSIVSGWTGDQLGGRLQARPDCRGKLFMVWDATLWTLWQPDVAAEARGGPPAWDDSAWFSYNPDAGEQRSRARVLRKAQDVTRKFFPAVAKWLGPRETPCEVPTPTPGLVRRILPTPTTAVVRAGEKSRTPVPVPTQPKTAPSAPETLVFTEPPINIYMRFLDGSGDYRLDVLDAGRKHLRMVFAKRVTNEKDAWASWDGFDEGGRRMTPGTYTAYLSKDGKYLRKIILSWIVPRRP